MAIGAGEIGNYLGVGWTLTRRRPSQKSFVPKRRELHQQVIAFSHLALPGFFIPTDATRACKVKAFKMSLLLAGVQALVEDMNRRRSLFISSSVECVDGEGEGSEASTRSSRRCQNASTRSTNCGEGYRNPAILTPSSCGDEHELTRHQRATTRMICASRSRNMLPPKFPSKAAESQARAKPGNSSASSGHFDIVLHRYGPSEEDAAQFHTDLYRHKIRMGLLPGQPEWEGFYPGSPSYERAWRFAVRPPLGGCIYCPFKEEKDGDLSHQDNISKGFIKQATRDRNVRNKNDREYRRWAALKNGGVDPIPDWDGIIACDELHEQHKREQLAAWGFPVPEETEPAAGGRVDEDDTASAQHISMGAVCSQWLARVVLLLQSAASWFWQRASLLINSP